MAYEFKKATKETAKLRLALFGPSGSGKTYTSLRMAAGLGGNTAFIDTERGSASKYADRFEFDVLELPKKDITTYAEAIGAAASAGYPVLIIDSLTHAWKELLGEVDKLAKTKYRGNTWSAWSEGTPKQNRLVNAILDYPGHIIATMRTKTEWTTEKDHNGKTMPIRVGLSPEQGKGIEYEFDLLMELTVEHVATVIKDRTGKYQDAIIEKPGEDLGRDLAAWLSDGVAPVKRETPTEDTKPPRQQSVQAPTKTKDTAPDADIDAWDAEERADTGGSKADGALMADLPPDAPVTSWSQFKDYTVDALGYDHGNHLVGALRKERGTDKTDVFWNGARPMLVVDGVELLNADACRVIWRLAYEHKQA